MCAGRHLEGHDANRFFARSNPRGLSLTIQHFYRRLLFDLEFGGLLIAQLRVLETVEGLGRPHPVQLVHQGSVDGVWFGAVVADGVADQQAAIFLIQIADPHLDRLRGALLRGQ